LLFATLLKIPTLEYHVDSLSGHSITIWRGCAEHATVEKDSSGRDGCLKARTTETSVVHEKGND
jgi:hypothetical protein